MKKFQIKENITKEEASKYQNFNDVLLKYQGLSIPFYKSPFFIGGGVLATVITAFVLSQNIFTDSIKDEVYANKAYEVEYHTPIDHEVNKEVLKVKLKNRQVQVKTKNGTLITIPANSLVDKYGQVIKGDVDIEFTDVLDQKGIFLSGIPMKIDEDGEEMVFKSGGMFKILAFQNGEPLFIKDGENVNVQLASKELGDDFNQYYLNPETNEWEYIKKDNYGIESQTLNSIADSLFEKSNLEEVMKQKSIVVEQISNLNKPIKPVKEDANKQTFSINVDYADFPELKAFRNILFQVSEKEKSFNPDYTKVLWENTSISRGEESDEFVVCFEKSDKDVCFITNPVVRKTDFDGAKEDYKILLEKYNTTKDSLKRRKKEAIRVIAERTRELNDQKMRVIEKMNRELAVIVENKITRTFQIGKFGIWNSDVPEKIPSQAVVLASFVDQESGDKIILNEIFLVQKDRNVVLSIPKYEFEEGLKYNPKEECMIWGVADDKKSVAVLTVSQYKKLNPKMKTAVLDMELIPAKEFVSFSLEEILNL